jgi:hypothetical protein
MIQKYTAFTKLIFPKVVIAGDLQWQPNHISNQNTSASRDELTLPEYSFFISLTRARGS